MIYELITIETKGHSFDPHALSSLHPVYLCQVYRNIVHYLNKDLPPMAVTKNDMYESF